MAETGKSLIDEAFMEAENIDKAFKANAKEILSHTMSSEIEEMVKESLEGSNGLNEDEDEENVELELVSSDEAGLDAGDDLEIGDEEMEADEVEMELNDDEELEMDVIDLTDAEDSDVVNVFKKMSPEDEIEVVQDGDNIDIKDNETGAEYRIELGGEETEEEVEDESEEIEMIDLEMDAEDMEDMDDEEMDDDMSEGVIYEIHMDDESEEIEMIDLEDFLPTDEIEVDGDIEIDDEIEENTTRNNPNGRRQRLRPDNFPKSLERPGVRNESKKPKFLKLIKENDTLKGEVSSIKTENKTLKEDYNNMVDALKQFRNKLNEVAVFNSNLTYTVRLFTEHTTTKNEKLDVIKRFDEVKSLKESKNTYKSLVKEISTTKAPIKETIEEKFNETKGSGSAQITESNVYINPEFEQMKKLWDYDYKN